MSFSFEQAKAAPIVKIALDKSVELFVKREDLIHPEISGNKFWKLFYNVNRYLDGAPQNPQLITFGGAYSNHLAATAALGNRLGIKTLGIVRGDELAGKWAANPTLLKAGHNGMQFRFVTRSEYRDKEKLTDDLQTEFPDALIIPEGGTNEQAVEGVKFMLGGATKDFDYLCCPVGTGGTVAGISKFAEEKQKVLGFKVVRDASLDKKISALSGRENFCLVDASGRGYGKFSDENIRFIDDFYARFKIPLEPVYTGKMFEKIFELIDEGFFPQNSRILAFHTGGLQAGSGEA